MSLAAPYYSFKTIVPDRDRGELLAFHVYAPAMRFRLEHPELELPCMAVRSSLTGYKWMQLFHAIEGDKFFMEELFGDPLPGTGKSGVAIPFTREPLVVTYRADIPQCSFNTADCCAERTLADLIQLYSSMPQPTRGGRGS